MGMLVVLGMVLICGAVLATGDENGAAAAGGASFVFGDSLVDAGNNNYISSLSRADIRPNGIDFKASHGRATGRFTNGRTIADIVGEMLGLPSYAPPFMAPTTKGPAILNGVNYASGGGGILNSTGKIFVNRIGMDLQIDYFNITRKQIDDLIGKDAARKLLAKDAVVSIIVGSNDFLNNYLFPVVSVGERASQSPDAFIDDLITHMRAHLTRLYDLDARKFVVANVGPLGCIPYQKSINKVGEEECAALPNQLAQRYNARLRDLLADLNRSLPGAKFCLVDVYGLTMDLITNHQSYGFTTASDACCGGSGGQYAGLVPCNPTSSLCGDRAAYLFWDPYHPSEAANLIFAKLVVDGDGKYISPINIRQLQAL